MPNRPGLSSVRGGHQRVDLGPRGPFNRRRCMWRRSCCQPKEIGRWPEQSGDRRGCQIEKIMW